MAPCPAPAKADDKKDKKKEKKDKGQSDTDLAPGATPAEGDCAATPITVDPDKVVDPGSQMVKVKPGSIEDVSAVGNRDIGGRGMGNWYSTDSEIKMGKEYADEIEKSAKLHHRSGG